MATDFKKQATQEYDSSYNQKVQTLKNQLAQNTQTLEQQKGGITANYNTQVANQNLANQKSRNNISNSALGRGLQNSSIVTSGLAEADQINNRMVGQINNDRTGALNNIDQQKATLAQNMEGTLGTMSADRLNEIATLARTLEDRDFDKSYKNNQLDMERDKILKDQQYRNLTLAQEKELYNSNLAWQKENAAQQLAWDKQKLAQTLAASGSGGGYGGYGGSSGSGGSGDGTDDAYNAYLAKYSEIVSSGASQTEKRNALTSLKSEVNMYSNKYGTNYNDIIGAINNNLVTANGASINSTKGITRSTATYKPTTPAPTPEPTKKATPIKTLSSGASKLMSGINKLFK